jgi:hypothetical protein
MKSFKEFIYECYKLEESSGGERSGRRTRGKLTLARGRGADMTARERITASISKKAGLKGTGKYSTKDLRAKSREYTNYDGNPESSHRGSIKQDHYVYSHSSPRRAAQHMGLTNKGKVVQRRKPSGIVDSGGRGVIKIAPSSEGVRKVKDFKKSLVKSGSNKTGEVHNVDILNRDKNIKKGNKRKQLKRGRNFIQALKDTPEHLKKAGAKKGDAVIGKPTAVMSGEDEKTGEAKRAKLYKKTFGKKSSEKSNKTGLMVGKVD